MAKSNTRATGKIIYERDKEKNFITMGVSNSKEHSLKTNTKAPVFAMIVRAMSYTRGFGRKEY